VKFTKKIKNSGMENGYGETRRTKINFFLSILKWPSSSSMFFIYCNKILPGNQSGPTRVKQRKQLNWTRLPILPVFSALGYQQQHHADS
jgi:hypothetical protein